MAGGIRNSSEHEFEENHEINVTPFIDVMLVLLIIFMVAAPLATVDIPVDLPASTAKPQERPAEPLYLSLKSDLTLNLGENPVEREGLQSALVAASEGDKATRIFLRADKSVAYEQLMAVMNLLRDAGYLKIALVGLETVPAIARQAGSEIQPGVRTGAGPPDNSGAFQELVGKPAGVSE
ncbi:TonB system transport protein ExbD [Roseibium algae]|uniref:Biopolymer transport protein ExbD n=1 Tax=Roseibium algae TaxID=3123038 RepID=A0ABU8TE97_9HYPH